MNKRFPQYLHLPVRIANKIEIEDIIIGVFIWFIGFVSTWAIWVVGFITIIKYMKVKKNNPRGFLNHWLMKIGIKEVQYYPPLLENRYVE